jgi:hypothetical protein
MPLASQIDMNMRWCVVVGGHDDRQSSLDLPSISGQSAQEAVFSEPQIAAVADRDLEDRL